MSDLNLLTRVMIVGLPTFAALTAAIGVAVAHDDDSKSFWQGWGEAALFIVALAAGIAGICFAVGYAIMSWHWAFTGVWAFPS